MIIKDDPLTDHATQAMFFNHQNIASLHMQEADRQVLA